MFLISKNIFLLVNEIVYEFIQLYTLNKISISSHDKITMTFTKTICLHLLRIASEIC